MTLLEHLEAALIQARSDAIPNKEDVVACLEMSIGDIKYWLQDLTAAQPTPNGF